MNAKNKMLLVSLILAVSSAFSAELKNCDAPTYLKVVFSDMHSISKRSTDALCKKWYPKRFTYTRIDAKYKFNIPGHSIEYYENPINRPLDSSHYLVTGRGLDIYFIATIEDPSKKTINKEMFQTALYWNFKTHKGKGVFASNICAANVNVSAVK